MAGYDMMTASEVAGMLRVSVWRVWGWAKSGKLPSIQLGRNYRFRRSEVESWLAAGGVHQATLEPAADLQPTA